MHSVHFPCENVCVLAKVNELSVPDKKYFLFLQDIFPSSVFFLTWNSKNVDVNGIITDV